MNNSDEIRITRWIDGELSDEDVRDLLEAHPELRVEKEQAVGLGELLRREMTSSRDDVPYADFFNHRIQHRIEEDEATVHTRDAWRLFPILMRTRWIAGVATLLLLVAWVGIGTNWFGLGESGQSRIVDVYTPNPSHEAHLRFSREAGVMVLELEGLDAIPPSSPVAGFFEEDTWRQTRVAWSTDAMAAGKMPEARVTLAELNPDSRQKP